MRKIKNREFKIATVFIEQDSTTAQIKIISVSQSLTLAQLLEPIIRKAPDGGFDNIDLTMLEDRTKTARILKNLEHGVEFKVEDAIFNTIVKAGKEFRPAFACEDMVEFKKYFIELEEMDKKLKEQETKKK